MPNVCDDSKTLPLSERLRRVWHHLTEEQQAEVDRLLRQSTSLDLSGFVEATTHFKLEGWQQKICRRLEQLPFQTGQRVLIHSFPQAGKSIIVSQRFPAYSIGKRPDLRFRLACYNEMHAERFSRVNLAVLRDPAFAEAFPGVALPPVNAAAKEWSTGQRKAARDGQPSFVALGIGSGFVGMGADLLVIDDPYKSREEAFSDVTNENVWLWWSDVVLPRLNPDTNVVVMFHRWRSNDLAGRLLEQGGWELLRFPAIADGLAGDCSDLPPGEPLSARFSVPFLRSVEAQQGALAFNALYQGNPGDATGNLIKAEYFRSYCLQDGFYHLQRDGRTERVRQSDLWRFCTVDWASSDAKTADWTVCTTWGVTPRNDLLVLYVKRGREEGPEAKGLVRAELQRWQPTFAVVEKNGLGLPMTQDLQREGWPIRGVWQHTKKEVRAQGLAVAYENGRVFHPREADWLSDWTKELLAFPAGANDDQLDTGSLAARAIVGACAVIGNFTPSLHVALDPIPWERRHGLVCGWGVEPVPAAVWGFMDDGALCVLGSCAARIGEGFAAFLERVCREQKEQFGRPAQSLGVRHWLANEYLDGTKGHYGPLFVALETYAAPVRRVREDRDAAIRERCKEVIDGRPQLLIDPGAQELVTALGGGYVHKMSAQGMPSPEVENNADKALVEALGNLCVSVAAISVSVPDPVMDALRAQRQFAPATRTVGAGRRGR